MDSQRAFWHHQVNNLLEEHSIESVVQLFLQFCSQILVEALVMTGTNPSLMIVREWILNGHLQGEQAVSAVTMLPSSIKTPTKEILSKLIVSQPFSFISVAEIL